MKQQENRTRIPWVRPPFVLIPSVYNAIMWCFCTHLWAWIIDPSPLHSFLAAAVVNRCDGIGINCSTGKPWISLEGSTWHLHRWWSTVKHSPYVLTDLFYFKQNACLQNITWPKVVCVLLIFSCTFSEWQWSEHNLLLLLCRWNTRFLWLFFEDIPMISSNGIVHLSTLCNQTHCNAL